MFKQRCLQALSPTWPEGNRFHTGYYIRQAVKEDQMKRKMGMVEMSRPDSN